MRRLRVLLVVVGLSLLAGSHDAGAGRPRCENTHCGWFCSVYGPIAGYCSAPAESDTIGCIQLYGPDCASLQGAYCCTTTSGAL
jgi:hypothetical protein